MLATVGFVAQVIVNQGTGHLDAVEEALSRLCVAAEAPFIPDNAIELRWRGRLRHGPRRRELRAHPTLTEAREQPLVHRDPDAEYSES